MKAKVLGRILIGLSLAIFLSTNLQGQPRDRQLRTALYSAPNDSEKLNAYINIAEYYSYLAPDSAKSYLDEGVAYFTKSGNELAVSWINVKQSDLESLHGNMSGAERLLQSAMSTFRRLHNKKGIDKVTNDLGVLEGRKGNFDKATSYFIEALKLGQEIADTFEIVASYTSLALINSDMGRMNLAIDYCNKALSLIRDSGEVRTVCNIYNNLGIMYGKMGKFDSAKLYLERAKEKSNKDEYVDVRLYALMNLGIVYEHMGDNTKALSYLDEALDLTIKKNLPGEQMQALINKASVLEQTHEPETATKLLQQAVILGKNLGNKLFLSDAYAALVDVYKETGKYKEAVWVLEDESRIKDSLYSVDKEKEIANLQAIYDLDRSNSKVRELNLLKQRQQLRYNILAVLTAALFLFIVFYFIITRRHAQVLLAQKEDLKKSNGIKDKLFSIIGHDLRGPLNNISMILESLDGQGDIVEERELLNLLQTQTRASVETLNSLLLWGKSQFSESSSRREIIRPSHNVDHIIDLLSLTAKQKEVTIKNVLAPSLTIHGISDHFNFIIRNLLSNAIKYSYRGGSITVYADERMQQDATVFCVKDEGAGIPAQMLLVIFGGAGITNRGTEGEKGSGIGLALCKEFIIANKGNIWAENNNGKGATLFFSFPVV